MYLRFLSALLTLSKHIQNNVYVHWHYSGQNTNRTVCIIESLSFDIIYYHLMSNYYVMYSTLQALRGVTNIIYFRSFLVVFEQIWLFLFRKSSQKCNTQEFGTMFLKQGLLYDHLRAKQLRIILNRRLFVFRKHWMYVQVFMHKLL